MPKRFIRDKLLDHKPTILEYSEDMAYLRSQPRSRTYPATVDQHKKNP